MVNSRSLGIVIIVSTCFFNSFQPSSAFFILAFASKKKGLVTTATVSAPISLLIFATTGAPPVPVPPPRPAVIKTISAPLSTPRISSRLSRAASLPRSGSAPAPSPLVMPGPSCRQTSALEFSRACMSVLAAMNSIPRSLLSTMVLTAFPPPPPIPITLILANDSSAILNSIFFPPFQLLFVYEIRKF